jgi:hypothetical protein
VLTAFGAASVSLMAGAYALEERHSIFIVVFAVACLLAGMYAALIGSVPFTAVETLWCLFAVQRFRRVKSRPHA